VNDQLPAAMPRPDAGLIDCAQCGMIGHHKKMIKSQRQQHAEEANWDEKERGMSQMPCKICVRCEAMFRKDEGNPRATVEEVEVDIANLRRQVGSARSSAWSRATKEAKALGEREGKTGREWRKDRICLVCSFVRWEIACCVLAVLPLWFGASLHCWRCAVLHVQAPYCEARLEMAVAFLAAAKSLIPAFILAEGRMRELQDKQGDADRLRDRLLVLENSKTKSHAEWWDEEYEKLQAQLDAVEERIDSGFQPEAFQDHQNQARTAFL
jgi:hypothetical protein